MGLISAPDGRPATDTVHDLTVKGAITLANFHILAQRFGWSIRCESCGSPIQGKNTDNDKYYSVSCRCTEWRCESKDLAGRI